MKAKLTTLVGCFISLLSLLVNLAIAESNENESLQAALAKLGEASMQEKAKAIEELTTIKTARTTIILQALLDGQLYKLKADGKFVIANESGNEFNISNANTGETLGMVDKSSAQKVTLNNSLRVSLRKSLGRLQLNADEASIRMAAVKAMAKSMDEESLKLLRDRLTIEQEHDVQEAIKQVLALA